MIQTCVQCIQMYKCIIHVSYTAQKKGRPLSNTPAFFVEKSDGIPIRKNKKQKMKKTKFEMDGGQSNWQEVATKNWNQKVNWIEWINGLD